MQLRSHLTFLDMGSLICQRRPPIDLILVLDRSSSMSGSKWTATLEACRNILNFVRKEDRVANSYF